MPKNALFEHVSPLAMRQPKTDRLVLLRLLKQATLEKALAGDDVAAAHALFGHL